MKDSQLVARNQNALRVLLSVCLHWIDSYSKVVLYSGYDLGYSGPVATLWCSSTGVGIASGSLDGSGREQEADQNATPPDGQPTPELRQPTAATNPTRPHPNNKNKLRRGAYRNGVRKRGTHQTVNQENAFTHQHQARTRRRVV
ncbi:hypothetical protein NL676_038514 [Syzygium grande]|nr:hypothetical protein NL676_038514 [Syzygium grande]